MSNLLEDKKYFTKEEYLVWEETATDKHEFENGEIFAMSGGSFIHGLICSNINRKLSELLDNRDCLTVGSDVKVEIQSAQAYVYPDAMVICGKVEFADDKKNVVKNPVLVVEVLSASTESYDRGKKFKKYQTLPSFKEYVLISQTEPLIEIFLRQAENHWLYTVIEGIESSVQFSSIESVMALKDIYNKVEFEEESV